MPYSLAVQRRHVWHGGCPWTLKRSCSQYWGDGKPWRVTCSLGKGQFFKTRERHTTNSYGFPTCRNLWLLSPTTDKAPKTPQCRTPRPSKRTMQNKAFRWPTSANRHLLSAGGSRQPTSDNLVRVCLDDGWWEEEAVTRPAIKKRGPMLQPTAG